MPAPEQLYVNFALVARRVKQLAPVFSQRMGMQVSEELFESLAGALCRRMGLQGQFSVLEIRKLLAPYHGYELTQQIRHDLIWKLAGGWSRLEQGLGLSSRFESSLVNPHWTGLIIEDVQICPWPPKLARYTLYFRIVDGPYSGLTFCDTLSSKWVRYKLAREIGFARYRPMHIQELVGCCLLAAIDLSDPLRPVLEEFDTGCAVISRNQTLRRKRLDSCPAGYEHSCHDCHVGHTMCGPGQFTCWRGTHRATYVTRLCPRCKLVQEYDPLSNFSVCLVCMGREQTYKEKMAQIGS